MAPALQALIDLLAFVVGPLALLGAAAAAFGADSRRCIGDDHGPRCQGDWV